MRVLLTGASGFIGSAVLQELVRRSIEVVAIGRNPPQIPGSDRVRSVVIDDYLQCDWSRHLDGIDVVYHFGWSNVPATSIHDPAGDANTNVVGTLRLMDAVRKNPKTRFIFSSSGGTIYGRLNRRAASEKHELRAVNFYGAAKLAVEIYIENYRNLFEFNGLSTRIANPYGPGQAPGKNFGVIATFVEKALKQESIQIFGDGSAIRDYVFISDLVEALLLAADARLPFGAMNLGSGDGYSINDIVRIIEEELEQKLSVSYLPARNIDARVSILDIARAKKHLQWEPKVDLRSGIRRTINALQQRL